MSGILCQQTSLFVRLLAGFQLAMVEVVVDLMVGLSTMMPHLGLSGLRIKYLLAPVRPLWAKRGLSSGYTTLLVLRSSTIMATMGSSRKKPPRVWWEDAVAVFLRCGSTASEIQGWAGHTNNHVYGLHLPGAFKFTLDRNGYWQYLPVAFCC